MKPLPKAEREARFQQILAWREEGLFYREIGERLGITRSQAHVLAMQAYKWATRTDDLSVRARNVLRNQDIPIEKSAVRQAFDRLREGAKYQTRLSIRNLGKKTLRELETWAFE